MTTGGYDFGLLSHDVRKSFTLTLFLLKRLEKCKSLEEVQLLVQEFKPSFHASISCVDNLLKQMHTAASIELNTSKKDNKFTGSFSTHEDLLLTQINKKLYVIDDDIFILKGWNRDVTDAEVKGFLNPQEFLEAFNNCSLMPNEQIIVVTDFYFGQTCELHFYDFILQLRSFYKGPLFLSSDISRDELDKEFLNQHAVKVIKKSTYLFSELEAEYTH